MKSKSLEREIKFPGVELDNLRQRLIELEAERRAPGSFEDNWVLDRGGELLDAGRILRLRVDGGRARVTLKGPQVLEGNVKIREELEIEVDDAGKARSLLEGLGFEVVNRYQKVREEWQLGGVKIALDHTPIGDFSEFEGEGAEIVAKRCGLDPKNGERRSYLRLYEDYLKDHPEAPPEMVFGEGSR
ncbi:MAG TPA: class IV adenylate cyclase [Thermoanaerobaculia bacterium]|nr:class IV adenylate cyclase [Thermoanaerobaculia bacterium]